MHISTKQAAMARSNLNLDGKEVAEKTGIAATALHRFERTGVGVSKEKLLILKSFYENLGLEFTDHNGVREQPEENRKYIGIDGFRLFMDDVYETARDMGGDICLFNSKPSLWIKYLGQEWYDMHSKRMEKLGDTINVRITVQEGETDFVLNLAQHRWLPKLKWKEKIVYTYGNKLAFLDFSNKEIKIVVMNSPEFSESFKILFDISWDNAAISPQKNNG